MPRQEVSERIGLGRSSCASMPSGGPLREVSTAEAVGPWPVKPRLAQAAHSPMATFGVARSRVMLEGRARQKPSAAELAAKPSAMRDKPRPRDGGLDPEAPLALHGDEARFRAQAWGRVEAPVLAGESA